MDPSQIATIILAKSIRAGTPILWASIGEIFAEKAGVLNLGLEGMMLVGAMSGFAVGLRTGNAFLGVLAAGLAAGFLSLLHAFMTISLRADQVVSGLALTIFGAGLSAFFGTPLVGVRGPTLPVIAIPLLSNIPILGSILFNQNVFDYAGFVLFPLAWWFINRTRPGLNLRAVGEYPAAADAMGIDVVRVRYFYVFLGGVMAGIAGANFSLAYTPGWIENMTSGTGWIAVGLVIFAGWSPLRAAFGSYLFGGISLLPLDLQSIFQIGISPAFLRMMPYVFTIVALLFGSRKAVRQRLGAPAALGLPYVRGERGA